MMHPNDFAIIAGCAFVCLFLMLLFMGLAVIGVLT
jgi:hypothetical protein